MVRAQVSATIMQDGAEARRRRQQQAMAGAEHKPQQVRHDDADKADDAGERDGGSGHRRDQHDRDPLQALDLDAHVERLGFAEHEQIEAAGDQRHGEQHGGQKRRDDRRPWPRSRR